MWPEMVRPAGFEPAAFGSGQRPPSTAAGAPRRRPDAKSSVSDISSDVDRKSPQQLASERKPTKNRFGANSHGLKDFAAERESSPTDAK